MKILFASDMSFNYFCSFPGKEAARRTLENTAKYFKAADYSVVNLENILGVREEGTPIPKDGPNLISTEDFIEFVDALSPSAVGLANNHTRDFGEGPMYRTIELLTSRGYQAFGAGRSIEEAYSPAIFEKDGTRVAIFAVCENEFGIADDDLPGTAGYSHARVKRAIKAARAEGMLPIIYFHGGNERNPFPSPAKVEMYRDFVDMGAAAVIAMHTHCPQGYEIYEGAPIVYSMGNFFFPKPGLETTLKLPPERLAQYLPTWSYGYMSLLDVTKDGIKLETVPYKFDDVSHTVLSGDELSHFNAYLAHITAPIADEKKIRTLFDSWCMIAGLGYNAQISYMNTVDKFRLEMIDDFKENRTRPMTCIKNVFSCEAHNELITNTFNLIYNEKTEEALKGVDYICKLQRFEY